MYLYENCIGFHRAEHLMLFEMYGAILRRLEVLRCYCPVIRYTLSRQIFEKVNKVGSKFTLLSMYM